MSAMANASQKTRSTLNNIWSGVNELFAVCTALPYAESSPGLCDPSTGQLGGVAHADETNLRHCFDELVFVLIKQ